MTAAISFDLCPQDNRRLHNLCGVEHGNIKYLENHFGIEINQRGHRFQLRGQPSLLSHVKYLLMELYSSAVKPFCPEDISATIVQQTDVHFGIQPNDKLRVRQKLLKLATPNQVAFVEAISKATINFALGPAGTGKTYISVAKAIEAFDQALVEKIVFVRPAVEAGEKIGFLPGDINEKVSPYHRPIYDALNDILGYEQAQQLIQRNTIEITPIAFMRGRTLSRTFILLDEAQNTTVAQMKMFLTRLGMGSKMVIVGDPSQVDLDHRHPSGLTDAIQRLVNIENIHITRFDNHDVIRHDLISHIIEAYDR